MKRFVIAFATLIIVFFSIQTHLLAKEQASLPYFGVGATVQDLDSGEFLVETEGVKAGEGFVFTPPSPFTKKEIKVQVTLKGQEPVILKIAETDARGRFIKEQEKNIDLTNEWTPYELSFELESRTSQIDVQILTKNKCKTEFSFKDLSIIEQ